MKILIFTDSRGELPHGKPTWVNYVKQSWDDVTYVVDKERIRTIFQITESLKNNKQMYDMIIIQTAYSDFVAHWPLSILKKRFLQFDRNLNKHIEVSEGTGPRQLFRYKNYAGIEKELLKIKKHCKHLLFVGLHLSTSMNPYKVKKITVFANNLIAQHVNSLLFPINISWTKTNCYDGIHYAPGTHLMVGNYVNRYIKRLGKTISDYI